MFVFDDEIAVPGPQSGKRYVFDDENDTPEATPPVSTSAETDQDQPPPGQTTLGGVASSLGEGLARGITTEIPAMAGGALEFVGSYLPDELVSIEEAGKGLKEWSEAKAESWYGPEKKREGLERIVYEGTKMLAPSIVPGGLVGAGVRTLTGIGKIVKAAKAAGKTQKAASLWAEATKLAKQANNIASGSVAGLFGLSQAQSTVDTSKDRAASLMVQGDLAGFDAAKEAGEGWAPVMTGAIEAGGEYFGTKYLGKLFGMDESGVMKRGARRLVTDFLKTIGVEVGTEVGQQGGEAAVEKYSGIRPDADPLAEAFDVVGPTVFMTLLTGGLAGAANKMRKPDDPIDILQDNPQDQAPDMTAEIRQAIQLHRQKEAKVKPKPSTAREAAEVFFGPEAVQNEEARQVLERRGLAVPEESFKSAEESAAVFQAEEDAKRASLEAQQPANIQAEYAAGPGRYENEPITTAQEQERIDRIRAEANAQPPTFQAPIGGVMLGGGQEKPQEAPIEAIDQAADEAATSPLNDLPQPTEGQKEAGNYKKGHVTVQGMDVSIENPRLSERTGTDKNGKPWSIVLQNPYGYFKRSQGKDGDQVDVIIGPNTQSEKAYVVDQIDPETGKFDEHKTLIGFGTEEEARQGYMENYEPGWKGLGAITEMPVDEFKSWVKEGRKTKPLAYKEKTRREKALDLGASREEYDVDTEDSGKISVTVLRTKEGGVLVLDEKGMAERNPAYTQGKTDQDIIADLYEPVGFKSAEKKEAPPALKTVARDMPAEGKDLFLPESWDGIKIASVSAPKLIFDADAGNSQEYLVNVNGASASFNTETTAENRANAEKFYQEMKLREKGKPTEAPAPEPRTGLARRGEAPPAAPIVQPGATSEGNEWYVTGLTHQGEISTSRPMWVSKDLEQAKYFSLEKTTGGKGQVVYSRPKEGSKILDLTDEKQLNEFKTTVENLRDNDSYGLRSVIEDAEQYQPLEDLLHPSDLVEEGGLWDRAAFKNAIWEEFGYDFIKTHDGGIFLNTKTADIKKALPAKSPSPLPTAKPGATSGGKQPSEGFTRLYRAETGFTEGEKKGVADWVKESPEYKGTVDATGRWFSDTLENAEYYAKTFGDGKITFVDIPTKDIEKYRASNLPLGKFARNPKDEFFVSRELADQRQPRPPSPLPEAAKAEKTVAPEVKAAGGIKKIQYGDGPRDNYATVRFVSREGTPEFAILPDGQAVIYAPSVLRGYMDQKLFRYIDEYISPLEENVFVRVTSDPNDYKYLVEGKHRGSLNRNVQDWEQPISEDALSVAKTPEFGAKYAYYVEGKRIGQGADGEPLLDLKSVKVKSKLLKYETLEADFEKKQVEKLKKLNLTQDDIRALHSGKITESLPNPSHPQDAHAAYQAGRTDREAAAEASAKEREEIAKTHDKAEIPAEKGTALIGAYDEIPNEARGNPVAAENAFKADLKRFAKELQAILGYEPDTTTRGKKIKDSSVSVNIAPAGGDGTIILWKPDSDFGIYVTVSADRNAGDNGLTVRTGQAYGDIMFRATTKAHKFTGYANQWAPSTITPAELAAKAKAQIEFYEQPAAQKIIKEAQDAGKSDGAITRGLKQGEKAGEAEGADKKPAEVKAEIKALSEELGINTGYAPEIKVEGVWSRNGLIFATEGEAADWGVDRLQKWMMAEDSRAVPVAEAPNYLWQNGELIDIEMANWAKGTRFPIDDINRVASSHGVTADRMMKAAGLPMDATGYGDERRALRSLYDQRDREDAAVPAGPAPKAEPFSYPLPPFKPTGKQLAVLHDQSDPDLRKYVARGNDSEEQAEARRMIRNEYAIKLATAAKAHAILSQYGESSIAKADSYLALAKKEWDVWEELKEYEGDGYKIQGYPREIIEAERAIRAIKTGQSKMFPAESYSTTPDQSPKVTLSDVKRIFKGQEVIQPGGENSPIYVKTRGGQYLFMEFVNEIKPGEVNFRLAYSREYDPKRDVITGAYGKGEIRLRRDRAGNWTMAHESMHFLEDAGILSASDVALLSSHIKRLVAAGKRKTANKEKIGGAEDRANFLADALTKPIPGGRIGRIIERVREFIDKIMEAFGKRTARAVVRDIKSGAIFEGEAVPQEERTGYAAEDNKEFLYQDGNQEKVIHSGWDKGNNYRFVLEGTGDIFRSLSMQYPDPGYIGEKIDRIARHIKQERRGIHREDSFDTSRDENLDKFDTMLRQWGEQPTRNDIQKKAVQLNIEMLKGNFNRAENIIRDIEDHISKISIADQYAVEPLRESPEEGILQRSFDVFLWQAQDRLRYLNKAQMRAERERGSELPEAQDTYLAETLYHGKAAAAIDTFQDRHLTPILELMDSAKATVEDVDRYLHARHAKEANERLERINPEREDNEALSGMSDQEADKVLSEARKSGLQSVFEEIGKRVDKITKERREILVSSGLETIDTVSKWEAAYDHYVPLMREGKAARMPRRGQGYDVRGKQKIRAGSNREVVNILAHVVAQYEATAVRAEKAAVGQAFLEFAKSNPGPWKIDTPERTASYDKDGLIVYRVNPMGYMLADNVFAVKIDGKQHHITFDESNINAMRIASALKNLDGADSGAFIRGLSKITRYLAMVNTALNPEFIFSNFARDIQTAGYNMADSEADEVRGKSIKQVGSAWRGIRDFQSGKRSGEWAKWYNRFRNAGGQTGWVQTYQDIVDREEALIATIENMKPGKIRKVKRGLTHVLDYIADMNESVENAIRLSVFKNVVENGATEAKAARIAKELTVNFNRRGNLGPILNTLYLFFNASVQGSARIILAGAKSRTVRRFMAGTVVFAAVLDMINRAIGGDDDEEKSRYDKIAPWVKERNLIIMLPSGAGYLQIPLPWGYNVFHVIGQATGEVLTKKDNKVTDSALRVIGAAISSFNPVGGESSLLQVLSPSITDPLVQWAENKDWTGRKLRPSANIFAEKPSSQTYWSSVREPSRWIAEQLNALTGGDEIRPGKVDISPEAIDLAIDTFTGGAGKFVSNTISTPIKIAKGQRIETYEIPFLRRIYGKPGKQMLTQEFYENIDDVRLVDRQLSHYQDEPAKLRSIMQEYRPQAMLIDRMKLTQEAMQQYRDFRKQAENITDTDKREEKMRMLEAGMENTMKTFNKYYNRQVRKGRTP